MLELFTPDGSNMTQNDPGWLTIVQDDIPGVRGAPGGPGGARGVQATPGATKSDKTAK